MTGAGIHRRPWRRGGGMTLLEVMLSILILAVMFTAALETVRASLGSQATVFERSRGLLLAQDLMAEILQQKYVEPYETPTFGPEATETGGTRAGFDDVDDYNNWTESPPQAKDGTVLAGLNGWSRTVRVVRVSPEDFSAVSTVETGVKRVTVTVSHGDKTAASLVMIVTDSWQSPPYQ
jgi:MSHA pilin protein MshD